MSASPFSLLLELYPAPKMRELLSPVAAVRSWVAFEHALAAAQAKSSVITDADANAICSVEATSIDQDALWEAARNVGYPILPLVRQMAAQLPEGPNGRVHYGATTQDVMDTGQSLILRDACDLLLEQLDAVGTRLVTQIEAHVDTVMPGRTHGQQAVPTTFGAQLAPMLAELARSRSRLRAVRNDAAVLSLFGAGGTSAALGADVAEIRHTMGDVLGLAPVDVPWHNARDRIVAVAQVCTLLVGAGARIARNVIDLSRTEIGEVSEAAGTHRGASSTMPQKANPILAEGIVGMSAIVAPLAASLGRTLEVPQERAAGEWQIEWHVLPQVLQLTSATMAATEELLSGLQVHADTMKANLAADGGLIMSEAAMIALADALGRERAHDVVYAAALEVRTTGTGLPDAIRAILNKAGVSEDVKVPEPSDYLGDVRRACEAAVSAWTGATEEATR